MTYMYDVKYTLDERNIYRFIEPTIIYTTFDNNSINFQFNNMNDNFQIYIIKLPTYSYVPKRLYDHNETIVLEQYLEYANVTEDNFTVSIVINIEGVSYLSRKSYDIIVNFNNRSNDFNITEIYGNYISLDWFEDTLHIDKRGSELIIDDTVFYMENVSITNSNASWNDETYNFKNTINHIIVNGVNIKINDNNITVNNITDVYDININTEWYMFSSNLFYIGENNIGNFIYIEIPPKYGIINTNLIEIKDDNFISMTYMITQDRDDEMTIRILNNDKTKLSDLFVIKLKNYIVNKIEKLSRSLIDDLYYVENNIILNPNISGVLLEYINNCNINYIDLLINYDTQIDTNINENTITIDIYPFNRVNIYEELIKYGFRNIKESNIFILNENIENGYIDGKDYINSTNINDNIKILIGLNRYNYDIVNEYKIVFNIINNYVFEYTTQYIYDDLDLLKTFKVANHPDNKIFIYDRIEAIKLDNKYIDSNFNNFKVLFGDKIENINLEYYPIINDFEVLQDSYWFKQIFSITEINEEHSIEYIFENGISDFTVGLNVFITLYEQFNIEKFKKYKFAIILNDTEYVYDETSELNYNSNNVITLDNTVDILYNLKIVYKLSENIYSEGENITNYFLKINFSDLSVGYKIDSGTNILYGSDLKCYGYENIGLGSLYNLYGNNSIVIGNKIGKEFINNSIIFGNNSFTNVIPRNLISIGNNNYNDIEDSLLFDEVCSKNPIIIGHNLDFNSNNIININNIIIETDDNIIIGNSDKRLIISNVNIYYKDIKNRPKILSNYNDLDGLPNLDLYVTHQVLDNCNYVNDLKLYDVLGGCNYVSDVTLYSVLGNCNYVSDFQLYGILEECNYVSDVGLYGLLEECNYVDNIQLYGILEECNYVDDIQLYGILEECNYAIDTELYSVLDNCNYVSDFRLYDILDNCNYVSYFELYGVIDNCNFIDYGDFNKLFIDCNILVAEDIKQCIKESDIQNMISIYNITTGNNYVNYDNFYEILHSCNIDKLSTKISLSLDLNLNDIEQFKIDVIKDLSNASGLPEANFKIINMSGSIILEIEILPDLTGNYPTPSIVSLELEKQMLYDSSLLRTGNVTKYIKDFQLVFLPQTDRLVLNLVDNLVSHSSLTMCNYVDSTGLYDILENCNYISKDEIKNIEFENSNLVSYSILESCNYVDEPELYTVLESCNYVDEPQLYGVLESCNYVDEPQLYGVLKSCNYVDEPELYTVLENCNYVDYTGLYGVLDDRNYVDEPELYTVLESCNYVDYTGLYGVLESCNYVDEPELYTVLESCNYVDYTGLYGVLDDRNYVDEPQLYTVLENCNYLDEPQLYTVLENCNYLDEPQLYIVLENCNYLDEPQLYTVLESCNYLDEPQLYIVLENCNYLDEPQLYIVLENCNYLDEPQLYIVLESCNYLDEPQLYIVLESCNYVDHTGLYTVLENCNYVDHTSLYTVLESCNYVDHTGLYTVLESCNYVDETQLYTVLESCNYVDETQLYTVLESCNYVDEPQLYTVLESCNYVDEPQLYTVLESCNYVDETQLYTVLESCNYVDETQLYTVLESCNYVDEPQLYTVLESCNYVDEPQLYTVLESCNYVDEPQLYTVLESCNYVDETSYIQY